MIDFEPTEEQARIRETVGGEIRPRAREADAAGRLPIDALFRAREFGRIANGLPERFGGGA